MRYEKISFWVLWVLTELFFAYQFILRVSPGIIMNDLMAKFQINASSFGVMAAFYYLGYAGMQVPVGLLLDKYGPRKVVAVCALICVLGNLTFIYSDDWIIALIGRFLIGLGSTAGFLGASKAISLGLPARYFPYMMSLTFTIGYVGAIYGGRPVTILTEKLGWEYVLLTFSGVGLVISILLMLLKDMQVTKSINEGSILSGLKQVLKQPQIILVCICGAMQIGPLEAFADVWGINYLSKVHSLSKSSAAGLTSLIYLGLCLGGPVIAYISEKFKCHYVVCSICGIAMAIIYGLLLFNHDHSYAMLAVMMFAIGLFSGYQIIVFVITCGMVNVNLTGVTTSLTNMIVMSAGFGFHFIIGRVMDKYWQGAMENGIRVYGTEAYTHGIMVVPIALIIGFIGFILLKPKNNADTLYSQIKTI